MSLLQSPTLRETRCKPRAAIHFSTLVPIEQRWYSPKEVASLVGKTDQYIRDAFDNQKILGHVSNARARAGCEKRRSYQIHRDGVLLFLLETANYEPEDFLDRLAQLIIARPAEELLNVYQLIGKTLATSSRAVSEKERLIPTP